MESIDKKENKDYFAQVVPYQTIVDSDYNLSVSTYLEKEDTREEIDIDVLNNEIKETVLKIDQLRLEIDKIVLDLSK